MRYYKIEIGGDLPAVWESYPGGKYDPGAPQVEIDMQVAQFGTPMPNAMVRIYGVSLQQISQGSNFNGAPIKIFGGMGKGLPLSKPAQQGLLAQGLIYQAFGNWEGTNQTLDLIVTVDGGATREQPANISFDWFAGTDIGPAIETALLTAYPGYTVKTALSSTIVQNTDEHQVCGTIEQFTSYLTEMTKAFGGGTYPGVSITLTGTQFFVFDTPSADAPEKQIEFTDLIGQPTWLEAAKIGFYTPMRADLRIGDVIRMPRNQIRTTAASMSMARDKSAFQGRLLVVNLRHVGNSRGKQATDWATVVEAVLYE